MSATYCQMVWRKILCTYANIFYTIHIIYRNQREEEKRKEEKKRRIKQCGKVLTFGESE